MNVITQNAIAETVVKNSRFIAELITVNSQSEARDKLKEQKLKYSDATHVVHAFVVGKAGEVNGMSDDGEPSGTAGRPVLDVLKGSGITNVLLTVTRYFGGTLLGTGGLVHAYGDSAKAVLAVCQTEPLVEKKDFSFTASYSLYKDIKHFFPEFHIDSLNEEYGTQVTASGRIHESEYKSFAERIFSLSNGQLSM